MRAIVKLKTGGVDFMPVDIVKMTGRIYKPGKDEKGNFIDTVGVPDNRYQVYGSRFVHRVFADKQAVRDFFIADKNQLEPAAIEFFA